MKLTLLIALLLAPLAALRAADPQRPNVLFILADDAGTTRGIIDVGNPERPADAVTLVGPDGYNLIPEGKAPTQWVFADGILTASPAWDSVVTKEIYRDFRMHVEFNVNEVKDVKDPEADGNSGIYIQNRYEIQIHNSFGVPEADYKASYCGSIYRRKKPDRLVSKKAGEWQSFDIVFRAARFDDGGKKTENARVTVYQNGALIHDDYSIPGKTGAGEKEGPEPRPIKLQGHHNPVRFRNVWIQKLSLDAEEAIPAAKGPPPTHSSAMMISSSGTHLLLGFDVIKVDDRNMQPAQLIHKAHLAHASQFSGLAQGELAQFKELHREHHAQFILHHLARLAARHEQVIGTDTAGDVPARVESRPTLH